MSPRRTFGATWWGRAWVEALEGRAKLDPNRLPRGRTYARKGRVSALDVTAGEVRAFVQGSRSVPYRVKVRCRKFSGDEWSALLDKIGQQVGYMAALLDGELPPELAAAVDLLPGPGDLTPRCSCPDSADPCKHAAAVCYLVADEVDADPFVLFLLRGRGREPVLGQLRARRSRAKVVVEEPGLTPKEAFARKPSALPARPPAPPEPGHPAALGEPPAGSGLRAEVLSSLAADAAVRALDLLTGGDSAPLTREEDLARRGSSEVPEAWVAAWRRAGRGGLAALRESWQPPRAALYEARSELDDADLPGETRIWRNRLTRGEIQLRLGKDHLWYLFRQGAHGWLPVSPGARSPLDVLSGQ
ncbi:SWIM zinc finger family protein [Amycolatopsis alkalitolerans]|uniref:SWIM-type domain-containing protein n=1 Tax=Amycolatopsis alkalitolerans TaxID=2547244 RepID=A0A5C4M6N5_9PSEU|nr:SWIM zinc finger family protein [Amycolatopsis alkalitolerans]TNC29026.1 hypothetical protein FG385_02650 [Amycolatopsis alkalitolerans]